MASTRRSEPSSLRRHHLVGVELGEPEPALVPPRGLDERSSVDQGLTGRHHGSILSDAATPACGAVVASGVSRTSCGRLFGGPDASQRRVRGDRHEEDDAVEDLAPGVLDVQQRGDVVEQRQEQRSEERSDERAAATGEHRAAQEHGGEDGQRVPGADRVGAHAGLRRQEDAADDRTQGADHERAGLDQRHPLPDAEGGLTVVARPHAGPDLAGGGRATPPWRSPAR